MKNQSKWLGENFDRIILPQLRDALEMEVDAILETAPEVVAMVVAAPRQQLAGWIARRLRERGFEGWIVCGGPSTFVPGERNVLFRAIEANVNAVVIGEGEAGFSEFLEVATRRGNLAEVRGLALSSSDQWFETASREFIQNLDSLPVPDYSLFNIDQYTGGCIPMEWGRGCVRRCGFCEVNAMWGRRRTKSVDRILSEIEELTHSLGVNQFVFSDPAVNGDRRHFESVLDGLISLPLEIRWTANIVAHRGFPMRIAEKMRASGCLRAELGVESGSDDVLKAMRKGVRAEDNEKTLQALKSAGIETVIYLLVGYPGEGEDEFQETLEFLRRNSEAVDLVRSANALVLQRGSFICDQVLGNGGTVDVDSGPMWQHEWVSSDGCDITVRQDRVQRVLETLRDVGIPFEHAAGRDEYSVLCFDSIDHQDGSRIRVAEPYVFQERPTERECTKLDGSEKDKKCEFALDVSPQALDSSFEREQFLDTSTAESRFHMRKRVGRTMRVQLTNPPWSRKGLYGVRAGSRWPHFEEAHHEYMPFPFLLAYSAEVLELDGFEVDCLDALAEKIPFDRYRERVRGFSPDVLLLEVSTISLGDDLRTVDEIRRDGYEGRIVLCGLHASMYDRAFLASHTNLDAVLVGEYEIALRDLCRH